MMPTPRARGLGMIIGWDQRVTKLMNRTLNLKGVQPFFAMISWLGNGKFWYTLMLLMPVFDPATGGKASLHLAVVGLLNLVIYKFAKSLTCRPRPCNACEDILRGAAPLDEYSFPSGHTMHAVGFTTVAVFWFPQLALVLVTFTVLVALSRMILGLHYPTDVALGALLGFSVAKACLFLPG